MKERRLYLTCSAAPFFFQPFHFSLLMHGKLKEEFAERGKIKLFFKKVLNYQIVLSLS